MSLARPYLVSSILVGLLGFAIDRGQKLFQVSSRCIGAGPEVCLDRPGYFPPTSINGWMGGEIQPVTGFFDYVLIWNRGVSYGLLDGMPVWALGLIAVVAIVALSMWWWRTSDRLVRFGLMLVIGGAVSNALDRLLYGAVADFFHFYWQGWSFYIFNLADVVISSGVLLLLLDFIGIGRPKKT